MYEEQFFMATATAKTLNHYFEDWLGTEAGSEQKVIRLVENGLPAVTRNIRKVQ